MIELAKKSFEQPATIRSQDLQLPKSPKVTFLKANMPIEGERIMWYKGGARCTVLAKILNLRDGDGACEAHHTWSESAKHGGDARQHM